MRSLTLILIGWLAMAPAHAASSAGDLERARQIVAARCVLCHGMQGQGVSDLDAKLSAQNSEYIVKQLFNFKTGQRTSIVMQPMVTDLTAIEIELLARYFAAQPMLRNRVEDPELAAVGRYLYARGNRWSGVSACANCHGAEARGGAQMPRLAGQNAAYIEGRLRANPANPANSANSAQQVRTTLELMHSSISAITEFEIRALAQYLSGKE